jgi:hypothetical protein
VWGVAIISASGKKGTRAQDGGASKDKRHKVMDFLFHIWFLEEKPWHLNSKGQGLKRKFR